MDKVYTQCLKLNKNYQVIDECTVRKAVEDMAAGAVKGLYINQGHFQTMDWNEWLELPVEENDEFILTAKRKIRLPRVVVCNKFDKLIVKPPKLTTKNLRERDKDTCAYSGKKLKPSQMSWEHVIPVSKGGKTSWENIVLADKNINSIRGNRPLEEAGLKLKFEPFVPRGKKPEERIVNVNNFHDWTYFVPSLPEKVKS